MSSPVSSAQSLEPDPFRYGWRYVRRQLPDGTLDFDMVPLTLEDVLHPQEGDRIPENSRHERHRRYFNNVVEKRLSRRPTFLSLSDCLIDWDVPGLRAHSPDLVVLERDLPWPWGSWSTLHVEGEGARPVFVIEIVSPSTRNNDIVAKVEHYHRARVPLYVIVDSESEEGSLRLVAYRYAPAGYVPLLPDERGRLPLEPLGLYLLVVGARVAIFDTETEKELGDYTAVCEALAAEVRAREAAEKAAAEAERREQEQAAARQAAEQARAEAERREREQTQARLAAETRLQELQAELERLRGRGENGQAGAV
jgi:colicin import membrane protein